MGQHLHTQEFGLTDTVYVGTFCSKEEVVIDLTSLKISKLLMHAYSVVIQKEYHNFHFCYVLTRLPAP